MKTIFGPLIALLITPAFSTLETMLENYSSLQNSTGRPFNRLLTDMMGSSLENIVNYGCWCYFGTDGHGKGRGEPVNRVDEFCKNLHDGYQCIKLDANSENQKNCVPWEVDYTTSPSMVADLSELCARKNAGNNCAIRSCIVENLFITSIFQAFISGYTLDDNFSALNGFEQEENCFSKTIDTTENPVWAHGGGGNGGNSQNGEIAEQEESMCCGEYPHRFPHKKTATKKCCGSKAYDGGLLQCCDQDKVQFTC